MCPPPAVSGMGFGIIAGVITFANILRSSGGPGVVGVAGRGSQFFILSSGTPQLMATVFESMLDNAIIKNFYFGYICKYNLILCIYAS